MIQNCFLMRFYMINNTKMKYLKCFEHHHSFSDIRVKILIKDLMKLYIKGEFDLLQVFLDEQIRIWELSVEFLFLYMIFLVKVFQISSHLNPDRVVLFIFIHSKQTTNTAVPTCMRRNYLWKRWDSLPIISPYNHIPVFDSNWFYW